MLLPAVQKNLESLYCISTGQNICDFVFSNRKLANSLDSSPGFQAAREKLLVKEEGPSLSVSLFLSHELLADLERQNPFRQLDSANLAPFCEMVEGISHFVYLCWNASRHRSISCLELELQAEVDKFLTVTDHLQRQNRQRAYQLHDWLFSTPVFHDGLNDDEQSRYEQANYYAGKYCMNLQKNYIDRATIGIQKMLEEVRGFYRMPFREKIRHIEKY